MPGTPATRASWMSSTDLMKCVWPRMKLIASGLSIVTVMSCISSPPRRTRIIAVASALRRRSTKSAPVDAELALGSAPARGYRSAYRLAAARSLRQLLRRATRTVAGRVALDAPAFLQRPRVDRVEAELVEQLGDRGLGALVVAGDDQRATILRAGRLPVGRELRGVDVVERLDDLRRRQVRLQELGGRRRLVVELGDVAVALRVVVVGVDHDLARQRLDRNVPVVLERHGDDDDVSGLRRVDGASPRALSVRAPRRAPPASPARASC